MKKLLLLTVLILAQFSAAQDGGTPVKGLTPIVRTSPARESAKTTPLAHKTTATPSITPTGASPEVGFTQGRLSVSLTGAAAYQIPIAVPPGINGIVPSVSLAYNSQAGNGTAGYGWNLAGISVITRIPATPFHDATIDPVDFDPLDRFALDGQRLLLKNGSYGGDNARYQTENYNNLKITSYGASFYGAAYGPSYFVVEYPDGSVAYYGYSNNSRSRTDYAISYWQNPQGVRISYSYTAANNTLSIAKIHYGSVENAPAINTLEFVYKNRSRPEQSYIGGISFTNANLLSEIRVKGDGVGFRNYVLTHDLTALGYERLASIQEKSGDNSKSYNPTVFSYDDTPQEITYSAVQTTLNVLNLEQRNAEAITGDFDADGKMDFIVHPTGKPDTNLKDKYWLFTDIQNDAIANISWQHDVGAFESLFPVSWLSHNEKLMPMQGWAVVKTDKDSLSFTIYSVGTTNPVYEQYEKTFSWPMPNAILAANTELYDVKARYVSGDFNGDGLTDALLLRTTDLLEVQTQGSGFTSMIFSSPSKKTYFLNLDRRLVSDYANYSGDLADLILNDTKVYVADVTGDGKSNLLVFDKDVVRVYGLNDANQLLLLWETHDTHISVSPTRPIWLGDYNGDGKTDVIIPKGYGKTYARYTSTGTAFSKSDETYQLIHKENKDIPSGTFQHTDYFIQNTIPIDMNQDGKTDFIQLESKRYGGEPVRYTMKVFENKANTFAESAAATIDPAGKKYPLPVFLNADKPNPALEAALISDNEIFHFQYQKDMAQEKLLQQITNGNGVTETIHYQPLEAADAYPDGLPLYQPSSYTETYPNTDIVGAPALQVVAKIEKGGAQQLFGYYGAVSNVTGLGFLGFRAIAKTNWHAQTIPVITQVSRYEPALRGAITQDYTALNLPWSLQAQPASFIQNTQYAYTSELALNGVYTLRNTGTETVNALEGTAAATTNAYDEYGNLTTATAVVKQGEQVQQTTVTALSYDNQPEGVPYILGRPLSKTRSVTAYGETMTSEELYSYNPEQLLEQLQKRGHGTEYLTETYSYDAFGNSVTKTLSAPGEAPRTAAYQYDPSGRFVTQSADTEGLTTQFAYNTSTGALLTQTNPFGLTTAYQYDVWGKKTQVTDYLGNHIQYSYVRVGNDESVSQTGDDGSFSVSTYNAYGRRIQSGSSTISGTAYTSFAYDAIGRMLSESAPRFDPAAVSAQEKQTFYDAYGRVAQQVALTGKTTVFTYAGLTTTASDGVKTATTVKNALGQLVALTDEGGTVTYSYYPDGNLKTAHYEGVTVTVEQDGWGRKTRLTDPSAGAYGYQYNGFGELIEETTPKGTTAYTLSETGRLLQKSVQGDATDLVAQYSYDPVTRLLTDMSAMSDGQPFSYSYTYDVYQRPLLLRETTPYAQFQKELQYDPLGRVAQESYTAVHSASGKTTAHSVQRSYKNGSLRQLRDAATGALLWRTEAVTARGQLTEGAYGNAIRVAQHYDDFGLLTQAQHNRHPDTGEAMLALQYAFDAQRGLLNSRTSSLFGGEETFTYDVLDRLTGITDSNGAHTQSYDARGRITHNEGIGDYAYSDASPYRATQLSLTEEALAYYQQRGTQTVTYNAFKSPVAIHQKGGERLDFSYNPLQGRSTLFYGSEDEAQLLRPLRRHYAADGSVEITENTLTGDLVFVTYIGGDAYSAPVILKSDGATGEYLYLHRDYLGSIVAITNQNAELVEKRHFDAWGNIVQVQDGQGNDLAGLTILDRGYTGHEHLQRVGLIHMNGRLYDPLLHRFLAPDNYVQDPFNTQNFNRYGYVLNNPLMYTDESGEFAFLAVAVAAALFAVGNTVTHAIRGDIHNFGDAFKYFAQGAITGAALASLAQVPFLGAVIQGGAIIRDGATLLSAASGIVRGIATGNWTTLENAGKLFLGNFYLDENRTFFGGVWQGVSRFTWEAPQTAFGSSLAHLKNTIGKVDRVDYFGGATFATNENANSRNGISLGNFINIDITDEIHGNFDTRVIDDPLYMHEYGHTFDSQIFGLTYLFSIGLPSLISAAGTGDHSSFWTERWANRHAARYFGKHFGVDWTLFEPPILDYPR